MAEPITIDFLETGKPATAKMVVTMIGNGPWRTVTIGHSREIRDADGKVANPTVVQRFSTTTKPNRNVVFARPSITEQIVELANAKLKEASK